MSVRLVPDNAIPSIEKSVPFEDIFHCFLTRFANVPSWKRELILKKEAQALAEAAGVEAARAAAMKEEKDDKKKCPLKEKGIITKWEDKRETK